MPHSTGLMTPHQRAQYVKHPLKVEDQRQQRHRVSNQQQFFPKAFFQLAPPPVLRRPARSILFPLQKRAHVPDQPADVIAVTNRVMDLDRQRQHLPPALQTGCGPW